MIVSFNIGFTAGICYSRVFYSRVTARLKEKNKKSNFNLLLLNETFLLPPLHIYSYMLLIHLDGHRLYIYSASWPLQNGQLYDWSSFASHLQCTHWAHCFTVSCNGVRAIEILAPQVTNCCNCESLLVAQNKICTVTVFSGESVRTAMKLSLRCKDCKLNYGYSVFGNIQEGYHFLQRRKTLCWGQRRSIHGKKSLPLPSFFSVSTLSWL